MSTRIISGIVTTLVTAIVVALLMAFGYNPPDPPIPEEGVEVNVGDSDFGLGTDPEPASQAASYAPPAANNQVATQHTEPAPAMPSSPNPGNVTNPNATEQPRTENRQPEINKGALFPGNRNKNAGGSEGNTTGQGNMGNPNGTPGSDNYAGSGGNGVFSLAGREAVSMPKPVNKTNKQGKVVVRIWVNNQGVVTRAEYEPKGSNNADSYLQRQAVEAARKSRFNASPDAPEEQRGTITYIFTITQ